MDLTFRKRDLALLDSAGYRQPITLVEAIRGDTPPLVSRFVDDNGNYVDPFGVGAVWVFSGKVVGQYNSSPIIGSSSVTRSVDGETGAVSYTMAPSFDTAALNTLLGLGGTAVNYVDLEAQFQITYGGQRSSTMKFTFRVNNDVVREGDVDPVSLLDLSHIICKTTDFAAEAGKAYGVVTSSAGPLYVTLPANPAEGDIIQFVDIAGVWGISGVWGLNVSASHPIEGGTFSSFDSFVCAANNSVLRFVFSTVTHIGWRVFGNDKAPHPTGRISLDAPSVTVGETLALYMVGTWTNSPTLVEVAWWSCDDPVTRANPTFLVDTTTYTIQESDIGKYFFATKRASNGYGTGGSVISECTTSPAAAYNPSPSTPANDGYQFVTADGSAGPDGNYRYDTDGNTPSTTGDNINDNTWGNIIGNGYLVALDHLWPDFGVDTLHAPWPIYLTNVDGAVWYKVNQT